jgi:hypothetical protein
MQLMTITLENLFKPALPSIAGEGGFVLKYMHIWRFLVGEGGFVLKLSIGCGNC